MLKFAAGKAPVFFSHTKLPMFPSSVHFRGLEAVAALGAKGPSILEAKFLSSVATEG